MRAVLYHQTGAACDVLQLAELPAPEARPGEVLVRVAASGVNPHDVKKRSGWLGGDLPDGGVVPHSDGAGEVVACGPGVAMPLGSKVYFCGAGPARGAAAEFCVIPAEQAFPLPGVLSFDQGASLGVPAFTAWLCVLRDGGVTGTTILVQGGSGVVGRVAVEMAAWNGATVIATAGSDARAEIAWQAGAAHVLNYRDSNLAEAVLDLTAGRGVDRIVEVDLAANMAVDARVIARHGLIQSYSSTSDRTPVLPYYDFALKGVTLDFIQASGMRAADRTLAARAVAALVAQGRIYPKMAATFALDECAAAHEMVERGGTDGNVTVRPDQKAP